MATNGKNHLIKISGVLNAYTIKSIETELQSHLEKAKDILNIDINSISEIDLPAAFTLYSLKEKAKQMGKIIDINKEKCYALKKLQNYKIEKLLKLRLHWLDQDPEAETNPITPASGNFKSTYKVLDFKVLFCFYFYINR